ncbi:MAG TPA: anti-sigma factor [Acidobacteriota bacterium]|jgi:hypothetical protein|nr:anti-sigma factor [Acidobacteriota bacterium]
MNCASVKARENDFLDDSLSPEQRAEVERHLQNCQACRTDLELLLIFRKSLRDCQLAPPQALETLIMRGVNHTLQRRPFWQEWFVNFSVWREDGDKRPLFSKLAAVPVTLFFFALILAEFSHAPETTWYPAYAMEQNALLNGQEYVLPVRYTPMVEFAEDSSPLVADDSFVVLTRVDRQGMPTLEKVISAPHNRLLLDLFFNRVEGIRYRPLLKNGIGVDSFIIVPYQKISVVG